MKAITVLILVFLYYQPGNSNCQPVDEPMLYTYVDKLPRFNSDGGLKKYVYSNIQWPNQFGGEGVVLISFVIQQSGKVKDVKIERSLFTPCDNEVIRIFETMPEWEPGELDSKKIDVKLYFPVEFQIKN